MTKTKTRKLTSSEISALTSKISDKLSEIAKEKGKIFENILKKDPLYKKHSKISTEIKILEFKLKNLEKDRASLYNKLKSENKDLNFYYSDDSKIAVSKSNYVYNGKIRDEIILANLSPDFDVNKLVEELVNKFSK